MDLKETENLIFDSLNFEWFKLLHFNELTEDMIKINKDEISKEIEAVESIYIDDVKIKHFENFCLSIPQENEAYSLQIITELKFNVYPQNTFPAQLTKIMSSSSADGTIEHIEEVKDPNEVRIRVWNIEYLPWFELTILIPISYPSLSPPLYIIRKQDFYHDWNKLIKERFDEMYTPGFTWVFEWHSYLQDEFIEEFTSMNNIDWLRYAATRKDEFVDIQTRSKETFWFKFSKEVTYCPVWYMEYYGNEFSIVDGWYHYFCKIWMKDYLTNLINDGKTVDIKCPQAKCPKMMTDDNIKEWVEKETFEKLEKFRISSKVNLSEDSTWCPIPECSAVAKIKGGNMFGEWSECWFRFCLIWKNFYHSGRRWPALGLGKQAFESLSKAEQLEFIKDQLDDYYINKYSKNCPKWEVSITKMTGWNKMIWPQCGVYFWWKWMEIIQGYEHFSINPQCWDTTGQSDKTSLSEQDIHDLKESLTEQDTNILSNTFLIYFNQL